MTMNDEELLEKVRLRHQLSQQREMLEEQVRELNVEIGTELVLRGTDRYEGPEVIAVLTKDSTRESLDKMKLLQAGVSVEQLKAGTVVTTVSGTVRISKRH